MARLRDTAVSAPVIRCNMVALIDVIYVSIQLSEQRINLHLNGRRSTNDFDLLLAASSDGARAQNSPRSFARRFSTIPFGLSIFSLPIY